MTTPKPSNAEMPLAEHFDWATTGSTVDEQAATWLVRLTSGHATAEDRAEFVRWRDADPAHEVALSAMRAFWAGVPVAVPAAAAKVPVPPRRRRMRRWALAASLIVAVAAGYQFQTDWRHDRVTASGERRTLMLEDGSVLVLGGDTALDVDVGGEQRRVALTRGEVYFEVQPDEARPFVVDTGFGEVRVLGTRFSVRRNGDRGEVTVAEGRVRVARNGDGIVLETDQGLVFDRDGLHVPGAVNAEQALAWRSGRLVLEHATLDDVARLLNRHRAGTVVVLVDPQRQQPFNAVIDLENVDEWFAALEQQNRGRVTRLGPVTLIRPP